jgi:alpha-L-arabinofuranosidase
MFPQFARNALLSLIFIFVAAPARAQSPPVGLSLTIHADQPGAVINRDIFGQFAEHLGTGIYGGVWVGPRSSIPNVRGIRTDVVQALRELHVPFVRWPGGCFAEEYHWRGGIGPASRRIRSLNANWGNVIEPNTFGTHEYMDFIEQIGAEAYINANVASGAPQEAAEWLDYMTSAQPTTLARQRAANGRREPWRIKYWGLGNENWGCGGSMSPAAYVDRMKTFAMFSRNLNPDQSAGNRFMRSPNAMRQLAAGPENVEDTAWTEAVMQAWRDRGYYWTIDGLQLHYYTGGRLGIWRDPATGFSEHDYAIFIRNTYAMDRFISVHSAIMDRYDPRREVMLSVDEFGVWLAPTPGSNMFFLQQQSSLRDAIIASINLNIFARHAGRVRVAAIAQMANVLQSMVMTDGARMVRTPTYHVYRMYVPFQNAHFIPIDLDQGAYRNGDVALPHVDAIAARASDGAIWLALTNIDPNRTAAVTATMPGVSARAAVGEVLTAAHIDAINTFESPNIVSPQPFRVQAEGNDFALRLPPKSVVVVRLET